MPTVSSGRSPHADRPTPARGRTGLKQERAVRTRAQVLDAAAQAFASRGFPAVTVLDVAELTGMTKGAVYFHFPNKEALALAVADEFYVRMAELGDAVGAMDLSPLEAVSELLARTATAFHGDVVVQAGARLQIERSLIDADLPVPYVGYTELVTGWLTDARQAGQLGPDADPEAIARVLISAFFGAQHISWVLNDRADVTERVREILSVVLPALPTLPAR